jgi:hypothetical protein
MTLLPLIASLVVLGQTPQAAKPDTNPFGPPVRVGPYQVSILDATFATRANSTEQSRIADPGQKYLVLTVGVQNPSKEDLPLGWADLVFTVVGADTNNYKYLEEILSTDKLTPVNTSIKPLQKMPVLTYIPVPAADPIHKLMIQYRDGDAVRFDLRGKVKKPTGPYAGSDGVTVLDQGKGKLGEKAEVGFFDVKVVKVDTLTSSLGEVELEEGKKLYLVTAEFTNPTKEDMSLSWGTYEPVLADENDEPIAYKSVLVRAVGPDNINMQLKAGGTVTGRWIFQGRPDATPTKLEISTSGGRSVEIPLK